MGKGMLGTRYDGLVQSNGERTVTCSWTDPENRRLAQYSATEIES
jgi:hypothetical protein